MKGATTSASHQHRDPNFTPHSKQHGAGEQDLSFETLSPQEAASTRPMGITHNLPTPKYCKSNHQHIAQHLTQLKMDPTLCSKGSPTTKYFSSPEPAAQELCKITCYWKQALGSPLSMDIKPYKNLQTTYYYTDNLGIQHESPSLHRTILTYKLPPSSPSTHLSCSCKTSLIHPLGSLKPAAWLQKYPDSILPFLSPNSQSPSHLWNFRSPKFGFKIASSLAADGKNMM